MARGGCLEFDEVLATNNAGVVLIARGEKIQTNHSDTVD